MEFYVVLAYTQVEAQLTFGISGLHISVPVFSWEMCLKAIGQACHKVTLATFQVCFSFV